MGFRTSNQGRPIQGVSQQPPKTRFPGQCTQCDNLRPDLVRGLTTRQGTIFKLDMTSPSYNELEPVWGPTLLKDNRVKWHQYDRGDGQEAFIIAIMPDTGEVAIWHRSAITPFRIDIIRQAGATDYLTCDNPREQIKCQTIGDYTFLVNTTKTVSKSATLTPSPSPKGIVYVQFIDFSQRVSVFTESSGTFQEVAWYQTGNGDNSDHKTAVNVEFATDKLLDALTGGSNLTPDAATGYATWDGIDISSEYSINRVANTIQLQRIDNGDFSLFVDDDADSKNSVAIKDKISSTSLLPSRAPDGFLVEIDPPGANTVDNSSYWLKAQLNDNNHITWVETTAPGVSVGFDKATMPHVLVRDKFWVNNLTPPPATPYPYYAEFSLRQGEWADRLVGDELSNPLPTFINEDSPQEIQLVGQVQNRLYFTSGESVIMTRSGDFFNFFRESTQVSVDTDPVDIFADVPQINFLKATETFDGDTVFFSEKGQFVMSGSQPITPSNATLRQATSFDCNLDVSPVASGDSIFFAFNYGKFVGIREFYTDSITDTKRARPITDHINEFIEGKPLVMKTATNVNMLLVKSDGNDNIIYVYDWLWQGTDRVQSAWTRFVFPENDKVLDFDFSSDELHLIIYRSDNDEIVYEIIDIGDSDDFNLEFTVKVDRKTFLTFAKHASGYWYVPSSDPFPNLAIDDLHFIKLSGSGGDVAIGENIDVYREAGQLRTDQELSDVITTVTVGLGQRFSCVYEPTNPVALDEQGESLGLDRLTIGNFYMNYETSGVVYATVTDFSGVEHEYTLTPRVIGNLGNLVGVPELTPGRHKVGIRQRSDKYSLVYRTDSYFPLQVRDFEFNGNLNRRGGRV